MTYRARSLELNDAKMKCRNINSRRDFMSSVEHGMPSKRLTQLLSTQTNNEVGSAVAANASARILRQLYL